MKKRRSLTKVYVLILGALSLILLLIIINFFSLVTSAFSTSNLARSPIYLSPSLISLVIAFLIILIGGWIILWHFLRGSTKGVGY